MHIIKLDIKLSCLTIGDTSISLFSKFFLICKANQLFIILTDLFMKTILNKIKTDFLKEFNKD